MIKARHIAFFVKFFSWYSKSGLNRYFSKVTFECSVNVTGRPVLLIGNHFSWWDGFIAYRLNDLFFRKRFHIMMLEEQLVSRMFLNKAGAFSIRRGSRSVIEALRYTSSLLQEPENLVAVYPQGTIASVHRRPVVFERGVERIIDGAPKDLMILFYSALPDWYSEKKPSLTVRVTGYTGEDKTTQGIKEAYNDFLEESVSKQTPS